MNSAISRRLEKALVALFDKDYETSLLHCFPAIDKTASKRRPKQGVGKRFKSFLDDQRNIIMPIGLGMKMGRGCTFGGILFEDAVYDLARNNLVHEGEFADNFKVHEKQGSRLGGSWLLSDKNILALIIATVAANENQNEMFSKSYPVTLCNKHFDINDLWGKEKDIEKLFDLAFA
jgi:hypothetical protein